jgi:hypothetical protein
VGPSAAGTIGGYIQVPNDPFAQGVEFALQKNTGAAV